MWESNREKEKCVGSSVKCVSEHVMGRNYTRTHAICMQKKEVYRVCNVTSTIYDQKYVDAAVFGIFGPEMFAWFGKDPEFKEGFFREISMLQHTVIVKQWCASNFVFPIST